MAAEGRRKRPLRVTLIGILSIAVGIISLFPVLGVFGLGNLIIMTGMTFQEGPLALTAFAIAIANFVLGLGCLYGWRPVWFYLVLISVVNFAVALIVLFNVNLSQWGAVLVDMVWFTLAAYVLLSLQSKAIKAWFHI